MGTILTKFCYDIKQSFVRVPRDNIAMKKEDISQILARNLAEGMQRKYGAVNASELARASGVPQTTISLFLRPDRRIPLKSGEMPSPTLSKVSALAEALDIETWELLHPDPERAKREQEFYRRIERDFQKLPPLPTEKPDGIEQERRQGERRHAFVGDPDEVIRRMANISHPNHDLKNKKKQSS